jgi:hypothetical protein
MIYLLAHVVASMLAGTEGETMSVLEERFRDHFAPWSISIPPWHVRERRRGKIIEAGWAIWYLLEKDERGEYLDYYASHRMTNDPHIRLREDGSEEHLPTVFTMRPASLERQGA